MGNEFLVPTDRKLKRSVGSLVSSYGVIKKRVFYDMMMSGSFRNSCFLRTSCSVAPPPARPAAWCGALGLGEAADEGEHGAELDEVVVVW